MKAVTLAMCVALTVIEPAHMPPTTKATNSGYGACAGISSRLHAPHSSPDTSEPAAAAHDQIGAAAASSDSSMNRDRTPQRSPTITAKAASQTATGPLPACGASTAPVISAMAADVPSVSGNCR